MSESSSPDDLLERLRARAADPGRRTTSGQSQFVSHVRSMEVGGLLSMLRGVSANLDRVVAANQAGQRDPGAHAEADRIHEAMTTPAPDGLRAPAPPEALETAEHAIGGQLPAFLRRVYTDVADGGFGPGTGLLSLADLVTAHARLRGGEELPRGRAWPVGLVPLVAAEPGFDCVELASGRVVAWDPEGLSERSSEARYQRSFSEIAPSVDAWLDAWVRSRTQDEIRAEAMQRARVESARAARTSIAAKTPEERAAMGLPEVGWERIVWGGIGLDEEDEAPGE